MGFLETFSAKIIIYPSQEMKKYNIINNTLGWIIFLVAAVTYMLTIEPTASFWDCPEFIAQGYKLEIGHPPGNPMFILAARFAANFAGGDVTAVAKCVNALSALLSAATILLLFWTITHLVKKLVVKGNDSEMSLAQYLVVMGSGVCGALAYAWSDTFWFSAVEAEVYAFSSFCTALVFWLILKWENRADDPRSDRYLILIAFVFGISLGVHLLNLLAIPAIALIFYYRKAKKSTIWGSLLTLLISFAIIVLILYGLEPGFVEMAGYFELMFVNSFHLGYNSGVLAYAVLLLVIFAWTLFELHRSKNGYGFMKRLGVVLSVLLSGMFLIGNGGMGVFLAFVLITGFTVFMFMYPRISSRLFSNIILSMMMIFIGFSSYALVLIRSNANLPLDENSPNSPFALTSYLSRDQYGSSPLLYGYTLNSPVLEVKEGPSKYSRVVKTNDNQPDEYVTIDQKDYVYASETEMLFPRIHSRMHAQDYANILGYSDPSEIGNYVSVNYGGNQYPFKRPSMLENLEFFFGYQMHHMYWRYFMWNFAGRQNDIASNGPGDVARGNWISGIPFLDKARLHNLEYVPDELGKENKGHNVFFMLPLLLGLIGLLWQAFSGKKGIEQFWVVFFLFFMTGIAIVMYLNQTPSQPRERDYAYAGSFYAYAIWIGMGVAALWKCAMALFGDNTQKRPRSMAGNNPALPPQQNNGNNTLGLVFASICAVIGLAVPLQMVSQTWDDHDRSGRYCARDFGENYLQSLDKDAIVFCNGDNDTFPLWYLQEVEGVRTDVRAVNLSYLSTDWYIAQMQRAAYDSKPLPMFAGPTTYAYEKRQGGTFNDITSHSPIMIDKLFENYYNDDAVAKDENGLTIFSNTIVQIPANLDDAVKTGVLPESLREYAQDTISIDIYKSSGGGMSASQTMTLDLFASSVAQGWKRPVYFASTIPENLYMGLRPYMLSTGLCYQVTPAKVNDSESEIQCNTDKMYKIVTTKFKWGGLDKAPKGSLYLDETTMRMISTMRLSMMSLVQSLLYEGTKDMEFTIEGTADAPLNDYSKDRFKKAERILDLMEEKMPAETAPYQNVMALRLAQYYADIYKYSQSETARKKAVAVLEREAPRLAQYCIFYESMFDDLDSGSINAQDQNMVQASSMLFDIYRNVNPNGINKFINDFDKVKKAGKAISKEFLQYLTMDEGQRQLMRQQEAAQQAVLDSQMQAQMQEQGQDQAQNEMLLNDPGNAVIPKGSEWENEN